MGTNRMIKNRINRFFECAPASELHPDHSIDRWSRCSRIVRSRFSSDMELVRIDLTLADQTSNERN